MKLSKVKSGLVIRYAGLFHMSQLHVILIPNVVHFVFHRMSIYLDKVHLAPCHSDSTP